MSVENWIDPLTHVVDGLAQRDLGWIVASVPTLQARRSTDFDGAVCTRLPRRLLLARWDTLQRVADALLPSQV
jgi:hypothetical protein